jgi:hypothetical protein
MTLHGVVDACSSLCVGEVLVSDTFFSAEVCVDLGLLSKIA